MFIRKAKEEENLARYKDTETLYVLVGEVDQAISMYKNLRQHDQVSNANFQLMCCLYLSVSIPLYISDVAIS